MNDIHTPEPALPREGSTSDAPQFEIIGTVLVENTPGCTCGGGAGDPHEPYCGMEYVGDIATLIEQAIAHQFVTSRVMDAYLASRDLAVLHLLVPSACGDINVGEDVDLAQSICVQAAEHEGPHSGPKASLFQPFILNLTPEGEPW